MTITDRKLREKEEMRELILKAAMKLIKHEGLHNLSLRGIAEKIEYSPATVYLYFSDKAEIIHALHIKGFEILINLQSSVCNITDPLERLIKQGEVYMKFALENPEYYDLMFIAQMTAEKISEKKEWDIGVRSFQMLRDNVAECIEKGLLPKADVDVASFAMWSFVHGMAALIIRNRCIMIPEDQLKNITTAALQFLHNRLNP
jgi:AcrR family transcriptional regulator